MGAPMTDKIRTSDKLADALASAGCPVSMVVLARSGYYDDYRSPIATPCMQLVDDLQSWPELRARAMNGEFDAQKWESDEWARSKDGRETFAMLGKGVAKAMGLTDEDI